MHLVTFKCAKSVITPPSFFSLNRKKYEHQLLFKKLQPSDCEIAGNLLFTPKTDRIWSPNEYFYCSYAFVLSEDVFQYIYDFQIAAKCFQYQNFDIGAHQQLPDVSSGLLLFCLRPNCFCTKDILYSIFCKHNEMCVKIRQLATKWTWHNSSCMLVFFKN